MRKLGRKYRFGSGNTPMERESRRRYTSRGKRMSEVGYVLGEKWLAKPNRRNKKRR